MPAAKIRTALKTTGLVWDEIFTAAVDMSGSTSYKWVMPGSIYGEVVPATGASNRAPIGIAQNAPTAGGQVRVRVMGKSLMGASLGACSVFQGTYVTTGSHGYGFATSCGIATARASGSLLTGGTVGLLYTEVYLAGPSFNSCVAAGS